MGKYTITSFEQVETLMYNLCAIWLENSCDVNFGECAYNSAYLYAFLKTLFTNKVYLKIGGYTDFEYIDKDTNKLLRLGHIWNVIEINNKNYICDLSVVFTNIVLDNILNVNPENYYENCDFLLAKHEFNTLSTKLNDPNFITENFTVYDNQESKNKYLTLIIKLIKKNNDEMVMYIDDHEMDNIIKNTLLLKRLKIK